MSQLTYKFDDFDGYKVFARFLEQAVEELSQLVEDSQMLQARLLLAVIKKVYVKKVVPTIIEQPKNYKINLKEPEIVALSLLLKNYDFVQASDIHAVTILTDLNSVIEKYLIDRPILKREQCVNLLNNGTGESNRYIES